MVQITRSIKKTKKKRLLRSHTKSSTIFLLLFIIIITIIIVIIIIIIIIITLIIIIIFFIIIMVVSLVVAIPTEVDAVTCSRLRFTPPNYRPTWPASVWPGKGSSLLVYLRLLPVRRVIKFFFSHRIII